MVQAFQELPRVCIKHTSAFDIDTDLIYAQRVLSSLDLFGVKSDYVFLTSRIYSQLNRDREWVLDRFGVVIPTNDGT